MNSPLFSHTIRSFVLRQGHLTTAQKHAVTEGMPRWGITYGKEAIDLDTLFCRQAPRILEIGFGMGGATAEIAATHPDNDYLAIDVHTPGVGNLLKLIAEKTLTNVRIIQHDAVSVIDTMLTDSVLDGIHIFFPDPWPKKRHHKRRLIQSAFVEKLANKLKPHGYLHIATDWEEYAHQILDVLSKQAQLYNTVDSGFAPRPDYRPLTKFEQRGLRLGHLVSDIMFRRHAND